MDSLVLSEKQKHKN